MDADADAQLRLYFVVALPGGTLLADGDEERLRAVLEAAVRAVGLPDAVVEYDGSTEDVFDGNWVVMAFCQVCLEGWCPDCWEQEQFAAKESETLKDKERNLCAACWEEAA